MDSPTEPSHKGLQSLLFCGAESPAGATVVCVAVEPVSVIFTQHFRFTNRINIVNLNIRVIITECTTL